VHDQDWNLSVPPELYFACCLQGEPPRRLVGWQKVSLTPGQQLPVTVEVDENDSSHPLSYWDTGSNSWQTAPGTYTVYLGNSSAQSSLQVAGTFQVGS